MAALTSDRNTKRLATGELASYPVAASTTIYAGSLVCINTSGYAVAAANTAGYKLVGVAREQADNSAGSNGDINVEVSRAGAFEFASTGLTIAKVGDPVYISDDQTVSTSAANVYAGVIAKHESATSAYIDITPATRPASYTSGALSLTGALTVGVDDSGHDAKLYGATSGRYLEWDESADTLNLDGHLALININTETLAANKTLTATSEIVQFLDPGGAGRDVTLPAEASSTGRLFIIVNTADAAEVLTVKNDNGDTICTPTQNEAAILVCNGTTWAGCVGANS